MNRELLAVWAIVLLLLTNLITLYFLLRPHPGPAQFTPTGPLQYLDKTKAPFFRQPIDDTTGRKNVATYRRNLLMRSYGVVYDSAVIQKYITEVYPRLKARMKGDTANYVWKIGFYWMVTNGKDNANKLSFCVVPTLVSKKDSTIALDYFSDSSGVYRERVSAARPGMRPSRDSGFVYDEGQLWP